MKKIKQKIVGITKKGQATLPKEMRERLGIGKRALAVETPKGILIKSLPTIEKEMGSLKRLFAGKTARVMVDEARSEDKIREKKLESML